MSETFRQTAPAPLDAIPFNVPKPVKNELSNGLRIVLLEDRRYPTINFRLSFKSGDINDPEGKTGLNSAMASMLSEGTKEHSSKELAEEIERLGAHLSASASFDNTTVSASTLSMYSSEVIKLLAEVALTPTFPDQELELYKQNTIEGLKFQRSQPDFLADEQVSRIIYGDHPYSINSPTPKDIERLSKDELLEFHKKSFIPNNAIFFAVGDFDTAELTKQIEDEFGEWTSDEIQPPDFSEPPMRDKRTLTIVDRTGSTQSNIVLANLAIKRDAPDYFPVLMMNQILGAGASSRLFMNLREEKGYTYGAYSRVYAKRLAGSFEATSEVRNSVTKDSLKEFFFELTRIREEKASEEELNDAKNYLTGVFPIRAETQGGLTSLIVSQVLFDLPEDYLETYRDNIRAVSLDEVQEAAKKHIKPNELAIVIVGDADEVYSQAKEFAETVEVFDTDGNQKYISEFERADYKPLADVSGKWELGVEAQGQKLPVTLELKQDGETLSGKLESMLGEGEISGGKVKGDTLSGTAKTEFQGQEMELGIKGKVEGDSISGTITTEMIPEPLEFKGKRSEA